MVTVLVKKKMMVKYKMMVTMIMILQVHCVESGSQPTAEVGSKGKSKRKL